MKKNDTNLQMDYDYIIKIKKSGVQCLDKAVCSPYHS
jgi:hypothetical protein